MKQEEYKEGQPVLAYGAKGYAVELERCNDGKHVIHIAFPGRESQWRVPIEDVEVRK